MDYFLTEEQEAIRELARAIADNEIRPVAAEYDRTGDFPWPVVEKMAQSDLFGVFIDEKYGGLGDETATMNLVLVTEEFSKACGGIALAFASTAPGRDADPPWRERGTEAAFPPGHSCGPASRRLRPHRAAGRVRRRRDSHHRDQGR